MKPAPPSRDLDAHGRIPGDLPCAYCGYSLRTQPFPGNCPECGRAIRLPPRADGLRACNETWLTHATWGYGSLLILFGLFLLSFVFIYQVPYFLAAGSILAGIAGEAIAGQPTGLERVDRLRLRWLPRIMGWLVPAGTVYALITLAVDDSEDMLFLVIVVLAPTFIAAQMLYIAVIARVAKFDTIFFLACAATAGWAAIPPGIWLDAPPIWIAAIANGIIASTIALVLLWLQTPVIPNAPMPPDDQP